MAGLKYLYLTCLVLILYSYLPEQLERESVDVYANGNIIDNFSIEELMSSQEKPIRDTDSGEVRIRSGWTYLKGAGLTPAGSEERFYSRSFSVGEAGFICWELIVEHQPAPVDRDLNFTFRLSGDNDHTIAEAIADSWIPAGSDLTEHTACWGSAYPGSWKKGDYRYTVSYKSEGTDKQTALKQDINFSMF